MTGTRFGLAFTLGASAGAVFLAWTTERTPTQEWCVSLVLTFQAAAWIFEELAAIAKHRGFRKLGAKS